MANKKIRGITIQLGGDTSGLQKSLQEADRALAATQKELTDVRKALKLDPGNVKLAAQEEQLLGQAAKQTADRLKLLESAQSKVNAAMKANPEYEKRYQPIKEAIEKTTSALKELSKKENEYKEKHDRGEIDDAAYKKFTEDLEAAKKAASEARKAKRELDAEFKETGHLDAAGYREYEREVEKTRHELQDLESQINQTGAAVTNITGDFNSFTSSAKANAKDLIKAFAAVTAAVIAAGKSAVDAGMDFESSMANVAATMGFSTEELKDSGSEAAQTYKMLSEFAQELGKSTAYSATEASDALNYMALAGFDAETSISMLPKVLNLAAAGEIELAEASDMVTDTQSALGLSVEDTAKLVDKMAKTASKTNTSVGQLGQAMLKIGGTAKSLKGGTTELSAALGVLADNGIKGAEGGTKLRNTILSLQKAAEDGKVAIGDMSVAIYDAMTGEMRALPDIYTDIASAMNNMSEAEADTLTAGLFNKQDLAAVNALLSTTVDRWNELTAEIEDADGAAQKMADTKLDNLAGDITLFKSAVEGAKISISNDLTPSLRRATQVGTKAVSALANGFGKGGLQGAVEQVHKVLDKELGASAKTIYGLETATKAAAAAWVTYKAVAILENTINALRAVNKALIEGKTLTEALNSAMLKNPYALIAAAAAAAVVAIKKVVDIQTDLIDETNEEYNMLTDEQKALLDANEQLAKQMRDSKSQFEENTKAAEDEADTMQRLIERLFELDDAETLTAEQKAEMKVITDQLNESVEGLNIQLDEETGHLKTERSEIEASVKAMQKRAKAAAYEERFVELYKQQVQAEKNRADAEKKVSEQKTAIAAAENKVLRLTRERQKLEEEMNNSPGVTDEQIDRYNELSKAIDEANKDLKVQENALGDMQAAFAVAGNALGDINNDIQTVTESMTKTELEEAAGKASGAFDKLAGSADKAADATSEVFTITEEEVEDTLDKIDELTQAYNTKISNQEGMLENWVENNLTMDEDAFSLTDWKNVLSNTKTELDNWNDEIKALADKAEKAGIKLSDGMLEHLKTMGPDGIKYVQALVNGTDTELKEFNDLWEDTYTSIPKIAEEQYAELRKTTDKAISDMLGDVREQNASVRGAFEQLGLNGIDGYIAAWNDTAKRAELEAAVRGAISTAVDAAADEQESESPSKVFRRLGNYAGEGYALGIDDETKNAVKAASDLVNAAVKASMGAALTIPEINNYSLPTVQPTQAQASNTEAMKEDIKSVISELTSGTVTIPLVIDQSGQQVIAEATAPKINVLLGDEMNLNVRGAY